MRVPKLAKKWFYSVLEVQEHCSTSAGFVFSLRELACLARAKKRYEETLSFLSALWEELSSTDTRVG
jgi:hypothetical protein